MLKDGAVYVFYLKGTSKVLDVSGGEKDDGTNIQIYEYARVPQQRFQALKRGDYFMFKDLNSGKMIDVLGSQAANETNIQIYEQNDTDAQKWKIIPSADGYISFQSKINSKFCLDVKGEELLMEPMFGFMKRIIVMRKSLKLYKKNYINIE